MRGDLGFLRVSLRPPLLDWLRTRKSKLPDLMSKLFRRVNLDDYIRNLNPSRVFMENLDKTHKFILSLIFVVGVRAFEG